MSEGPPPRVFVSYSDDSPTHARRVLELAQWLRSHGVDAQLDQFEESPEEGWPAWVYRQIREAEFVLVIATPGYLRRCEGDEPRASPSGSSVKFGSHLTLQELHESGGRNRKFVPVLFEADAVVESVPLPLRGATCYRLPDQRDDLYRRLTGQPKVQRAPLGMLKTFDDESLDDSVDEFPEPGARARAALDEQRADDTLRAILDAGVGEEPPYDPPRKGWRRRLSKTNRQWLISIAAFGAAFMAVGLFLGGTVGKDDDATCQIQLTHGDGSVVDDIERVILELPSGEEIEVVVEDGRTLKFACRTNPVQAQAHVFLRKEREVAMSSDPGAPREMVTRLDGQITLPAAHEEEAGDEPVQKRLIEFPRARPVLPKPELPESDEAGPGPIEPRPADPIDEIKPGVDGLELPIKSSLKVTPRSSHKPLAAELAAHKAELERCYAQGLASAPSLRGRLVADVELSPTGHLSEFEIVADDLASSNRKVAQCVRTVVESWRIAKPEVKATTTHRLTIEFEPE